ncbi:hypothetical protein GQ53DRAFT_642521 [Thozetella sp. PMI_491]|nr:hypothetical protein GQ53DRAFT_642521 [Thozetella sp. PMI_491]
MYDRLPRDYATSNVLAWTTHTANVEPASEEEAGCDADEPPDRRPPLSPTAQQFRRTPIRRGSEHHESLLTKALQSHSEEESGEITSALGGRRRRSITSNISLASTTDLTCETGITTPARTSSPSPHLPALGFVPLPVKTGRPASEQVAENPAVKTLEKKRCISFACAARPKVDDKTAMPPPPKPQVSEAPEPAPQNAPKKSCIKFACLSRPSKTATAEQPTTLATTPVPKKSPSQQKEASPKHRSPSTVRSYRSSTPRRSAQSPAVTRQKKYLDANSKDLLSEGSRFHEFATDEVQEDDWIRRDEAYVRSRLTISDTLAKENAIRRLGKEAEEEADQELEEELNDEDNDENLDNDVDEEEDDEDDEDDENEEEADLDDEDDDQSGHGWDDDVSDGYNTDNEVGFADSDDEDDDLVLWTTSQTAQLSLSGAMPMRRQDSTSGHSTDGSVAPERDATAPRGRRVKPIVFRPGTPELPDSTDFVCGTLDEDRPLEDAYISCMNARRREKQIPIPQDIDPSFPNSEPEDEVEEYYKNGQGDSDDQVWLHGELEDIHHEQDRTGRKKKNGKDSPRRLRSPPPTRRQLSPAPKTRGRSPRRPAGLTSPRRPRSPAPPRQGVKSPAPSLVETSEGIAFKALAFAPGLTFTKSLPKAPAVFAHPKGRKRAGTNKSQGAHVRGAIDIVKGLEQKRQRRKEKFYQKYCNNRARKEKAHERLPPGQGAERMKEIGLGQARPQGNYVLSV